MAAQLGELSEAKRRDIERKLIELVARARTADADLESAKKTLEQTEIYLRVARAALEAGTGTELDVNQRGARDRSGKDDGAAGAVRHGGGTCRRR